MIWFSLLTAYLVVVGCLNNIVSAFAGGDEPEDDRDKRPMWVAVLDSFETLIEVSFGILVLVILIRTRSYIRKKYGIPEAAKCPRGCEDCCCSFWLSPCVICQLARHTADYREYSAGCCTETGLDSGAPEVV